MLLRREEKGAREFGHDKREHGRAPTSFLRR
jgi:hypothetical protein